MSARLLFAAALAIPIGVGEAIAQDAGKNCFDGGTQTNGGCAPEEGWYIAGRGGVSSYKDTVHQGVPGVEVTFEYDTGYIFTGVIGYEFDGVIGNSVDLRLEFEGGHQSADLDFVDNKVGDSSSNTNGSTEVSFVMLNLFADFELTDRLELFSGGGAGVGFVDFNDLEAIVPLVNESDTVFGFHVGAGASFDVTETIELERAIATSFFLMLETQRSAPPWSFQAIATSNLII